jgi:hypothetical protein
MTNTIRITIAALVLSMFAACSTTSHPPVCRDGKTCMPVAKR